MASQGHQKLRRNPSPSYIKQGPLKATKPYVLKISPSGSPTTLWGSELHRKNRRSPDHRSSPDRVSSPGFKVEKSKMRYSPCVPSIKRTSSLDAITSQYMKGEWPKDPLGSNVSIQPAISAHSNTNSFGTCDKFTQTDVEWDERSEYRLKQSHKRSSSLGSEDKIKEKLKARLAKNKEGNKNCSPVAIRISPVAGHYFSGLGGQREPTKALIIQHIPKSSFKILGSLEGESLELEKLNLSGYVDRGSRFNLAEAVTPDGHRAPVHELLHPVKRNVNTQTPSGIKEHLGRSSVERSDSSGSTSHSSSRSTSESPTSLPIIPFPGQHNSPVSPSCVDGVAKLSIKHDKGDVDGDSPNPSKCLFVREPPDGCEKIKTVEDVQRRNSLDTGDMQFCPIKMPLENFNIPSRSSAFCPLMKSYTLQ